MERFQKLHNRRLRAIIALMTAIALFFTALLYLATIANGLSDGESTELNTVVTTATENAARGNITDRYGQVLVTNRTEYNVTLDVGNMGESKEQLETLSTLLDICKAQKVKWTDEDLPISTDTPYTFTTDTPFLYQTDDGKWTQTRLGKLCKAMDWSNSSSTTASQLVAQMKQSFGLDTGKYTESEARELLGVLYSCYLREKEVLYTTYLFAEDVDIDLISVIKEKDLPGVEILPMSTRQYNTSAAALLLGQTGPISAESWEEKKDYYQKNNYNMDAIVGLSGAEYAFEKYLRGTPGTKKVILGNDGKTLTERYSVEPKMGSNVALTLDSKLQEATEKALAEVTPKINNGKGGSAAVVLNIKDGSILAAATYPTFDAARYNKDYKKLAKDKLNPLFNRALLGIIAAALFLLLAMLTMQGMAGYVFPNFYGSAAAQSTASLLSSVLILLVCAPFASKLANRFGKKELATVSCIVATVLEVICFVLKPANVWVYVGFFCAAFICLGFFNTIIWAMITDVIDDSEVRNGIREDGTIYAVYSFARKLGQAFSSGLTGGLLTMIGYSAATAFDPEVTMGIFNISCIAPAIGFVAVALSLFFIYPLTKQKVEENVAALAQRHNK